MLCLKHNDKIKLYLKLLINNNNNNILNAIGLLPGGSGYFTYIQNMKLVTNKFKSGGLHEKHVGATWNLGNHLTYNVCNKNLECCSIK